MTPRQLPEEDPRNRSLLAALRRAFAHTHPETRSRLHGTLARFQEDLRRHPALGDPSATRPRPRRLYPLLAVGALAASLLVAFLLWQVLQPPSSPPPGPSYDLAHIPSSLIVGQVSSNAIQTPESRMALLTANVTEGALRVLTPEGTVVECPLRHTDVQADVSGFIARVKITQTFYNPLKEKIEAVYVFPLPHKSAVDDMTLIVGERRIVGVIKPRQEARRIYEQARDLGSTAALLEQERPNIFTQSVANVPPGEAVKVEISYVDVLAYDQGSYEFHFPMVVGPRYIPGSPTSSIPPVPPELEDKVGELDKNRVAPGPDQPSGTGWSPDTDRVPDASRITPPVLKPEFRNGHDVSLALKLDAGVPVHNIQSVNHLARIDQTGKSTAAVVMSPADNVPNKDFVLRYSVVGRKPEMALLTHATPAGEGYFMLMIQPREDEALKAAPPREMVFLVDVSGSMSGEPTAKVRQEMSELLKRCKPEDTLQVITFANQSTKLFPQAIPVNPENIRAALNFTEGLQGSGGTEMLKGIRMALDDPADPKRVRIVVMLTDGFIGNESEIIAEVGKQAGDRLRFWCIGIGSSPNRFLTDGVARQGGGMSHVLALSDDPAPLAEDIMQRIHRAQLAQVAIDWAGMNVSETYPAKIPELWAGSPVVLFGRYTGGGGVTLKVSGNVEGSPVTWPLAVNLPAQAPEHEVLATVWARQKIEDLMQQVYYEDDPAIADLVTGIALKYRLMSQYTSFVAVDQAELARLQAQGEPPHPPRRMLVPVPIPEGTRFEGFFEERDKAVYDVRDLMTEVSEVQGPRFNLGLVSGDSLVRGSIWGDAPQNGRGLLTVDGKMKYRYENRESEIPVVRGRVFPTTKGYDVATYSPIGHKRQGHQPLYKDDGTIVSFYFSDTQVRVSPGHLTKLRERPAPESPIKPAQDLLKKGDLVAARARFAYAYLLAQSGQGGEETEAAALEGLNAADDQLRKRWTRDVPALAGKLDLVIRDQSLPEALSALARATGAAIELTPGATDDVLPLLSVRELRVTYLDLRRATLAQGLDWLLVPLRMTWSVADGKIVVSTARRAAVASPWVYDVSALVFPTRKEMENVKVDEKWISQAASKANQFIETVSKQLGLGADTLSWYDEGSLLLFADAATHAKAAGLFADLADPQAVVPAELTELWKVTSVRAQSFKEVRRKRQEFDDAVTVAREANGYAWPLLTSAREGKVDLEALTHLEVAWKSPHVSTFLKSGRAAGVMRSAWAIIDASRMLPQDAELADLARSVRLKLAEGMNESLAAHLKNPDDPNAFYAVLYATLAVPEDADFRAKALAAFSTNAGQQPTLGPARILAASLLVPTDKIDKKSLAELLSSAPRGEDAVALIALASRRAGLDSWNAFRAHAHEVMGAQPLPGSLVLFVNSLNRSEAALAANP